MDIPLDFHTVAIQVEHIIIREEVHMQETILIQGVCNRVKGAIVENGYAILSNKRFIYSKHNLAKIVAMGALVNLTQGSYEFEISANDIKAITPKKRLFSNVLAVTTSNQDYTFFFTKMAEWQIAFSNILSSEI